MNIGQDALQWHRLSAWVTFAFVRRVTGLKAVHGSFRIKVAAGEIDLARQRRDGYQPRATPWEFVP
jgi:hypothetical protein